MRIYFEDEDKNIVTVFKGDYVDAIASHIEETLKALAGNVTMSTDIDYEINFDAVVEIGASEENK